MMAELYGKETGYCKGKGGSMHIADMDPWAYWGPTALWAVDCPSPPWARAWRAKMQGDIRARSQPASLVTPPPIPAHSTSRINLASVHNLPVIYRL